MENKEQNLPPQPPRIKKWYKYKSIILIAILVILTVGISWVYFAKQSAQNATPVLVQQQIKPNQQNVPYAVGQMPTSTSIQIDTSVWKTYTNNQYGFSLKYPADLTDSGRHLEDGDFFSNTSEPMLVFNLSVFQTNQTLADYANNAIKGSQSPTNCTNTSQIIMESDSGVLFDSSCSAGADMYFYIFKNSVGQAVLIQYSNTFPQNEPAEQKAAVIEAIISSLKIFPATSPTMLVANSSGQLVIQDKYSLFIQTQNGQQANYMLIPVTDYQNDGIITSGQYAGYNRLVAGLEDDSGPGIATDVYIFATKDYKTFIVNDTLANYNSQDDVYNKATVVGVGDIPMDYPPQTVNLGNFVLTGADKDRGANFAIDMSPALGVELPSSVSGFNFYVDTNGINDSAAKLSNSYLVGISDVYLVDQYGLAYDYTFSSLEENIRTDKDGSFYEDSDLTSTGSLYSEYGELLPGGCGNLGTTYVLQNISSNDLVQVATTLKGTALYTLKDPNHPLNQDEYTAKVTELGSNFADLNNNETAPTFQQYIAKNPILIFQDPLGRWVGLGEFQYQNDEGCGKPVIYLYPTKPTEVTVKFLNPMHFSVSIPTYNGQWDVLANPDGELKDLQPEATDCSKINYNLAGSGYAQNACKNGMYPYLYWAGQTSGVYPTATTGWVVGKNDLSTFLNSKLTEIGLNDKEKADMMSYWVPELLAKNVPYYRLSFFQTQTMDNFIPMQVTPKPDTVLRVFLDWSPLTSLPAVPLQPETLQHIDRKGFTLVEWGGLKQ